MEFFPARSLMELVLVNNRWVGGAWGQPGQDNPNSYIILLIEEQKIHNDKFSESAARICVKCNDGDYKRRS